jgi:hypothetical protein
MEFLEQGYQIIDELIMRIINRKKYFPKFYTLQGIEIPIDTEIQKGVNFIGFVDIILKNKETGHYKVIDLKTSGTGWTKWQKQDPNKTSQVLLYKMFYAQKLGVPLDHVDVEFLILRRMIPEYGYVNSLLQTFTPSHGKVSCKKTYGQLKEFVNNSFDKEGNYIKDKDNYPLNAGPNKKNCKWCEFAKANGGKCNGKISDY